MDCSPPASSGHGISQARIPECDAIFLLSLSLSYRRGFKACGSWESLGTLPSYQNWNNPPPQFPLWCFIMEESDNNCLWSFPELRMTLVSGPGRAESQEAGGAWSGGLGVQRRAIQGITEGPSRLSRGWQLSGQFRDFHPKADFHKLSFPPCLKRGLPECFCYSLATLGPLACICLCTAVLSLG